MDLLKEVAYSIRNVIVAVLVLGLFVLAGQAIADSNNTALIISGTILACTFYLVNTINETKSAILEDSEKTRSMIQALLKARAKQGNVRQSGDNP